MCSTLTQHKMPLKGVLFGVVIFISLLVALLFTHFGWCIYVAVHADSSNVMARNLGIFNIVSCIVLLLPLLSFLIMSGAAGVTGIVGAFTGQKTRTSAAEKLSPTSSLDRLRKLASDNPNIVRATKDFVVAQDNSARKDTLRRSFTTR